MKQFFSYQFLFAILIPSLFGLNVWAEESSHKIISISHITPQCTATGQTHCLSSDDFLQEAYLMVDGLTDGIDNNLIAHIDNLINKQTATLKKLTPTAMSGKSPGMVKLMRSELLNLVITLHFYRLDSSDSLTKSLLLEEAKKIETLLDQTFRIIQPIYRVDPQEFQKVIESYRLACMAIQNLNFETAVQAANMFTIPRNFKPEINTHYTLSSTENYLPFESQTLADIISFYILSNTCYDVRKLTEVFTSFLMIQFGGQNEVVETAAQEERNK